MLKSTSSYKMSKATKTGLALHKFRDNHQRGGWKRAMIEAEISSSIKPKADKSLKKEASE